MAPVFSRAAWRCVWYLIQVCHCSMLLLFFYIIIFFFFFLDCSLLNAICQAMHLYFEFKLIEMPLQFIRYIALRSAVNTVLKLASVGITYGVAW